MAQETRAFLWPEMWLERCRQNPAWAVWGSLLAATFVAWIDLATGDEFPLIICYLPSVLIICWVSHTAVGALLAAACCTVWLVDDLLGVGEGITPAKGWMAVTHGVFYLVAISMLQRLRVAQENERRLARTDGLTGLLNAKAFRERAEEELARSARTGRPVSVAFIDCDNFKTVNDTMGHLEGDRLLEAIAEEMTAAVRAVDIPARMGGDEFAVLLPETNEHEAEALIERLRERLNGRMRNHAWPVTFSIGVAVYASPPVSVDALILGADVLMYEVKSNQKDSMVLRLVA